MRLRGKVKGDTKVGYKHFTEMPVWQRAHETVLLVYKLTGDFPESEKYALTSQMRRAAVSITSNIAEAFGRRTSKDRVRFYMHARGSCYEVQKSELCRPRRKLPDTSGFCETRPGPQ